jgi:hypothetical protein
MKHLAFLAASFFLFFSSDVKAQDIRYVKTTASGAGNGLSWANASGDLQAMINAVSTNGGQVWVASGSYKPATSDRTTSFAMKNGVAIYGGFAGTETEITQRNWTTNVTILSGDLLGNDNGFTNNSENSYNVIRNNGINNTAILDGFTIKGGNTDGGGSPVFSNTGAGMVNNNSSPIITNCIFTGNSGYYGGGMFNVENSSPILTNCSFIGNSVIYEGGGMRNQTASPILINCSFSGNTAQYGGGMANISSSPTIKNCIIWGNNNGILGGSPTITYSLVQGISSGTGNINGNSDPLFVDAANGNLRLQACSPAINSGIDEANSTTVDFGGNTRKVGTIDMGAYEFQGWVLNADSDGYYTGNKNTACASPGTGYVLFTAQLPGDCNDNDPDIHSTVQYYVDADQDGYGSQTTADICSATPPPGYATNNNDCNDNNSSIFPGSQGRIYVNKIASGNNSGVSWLDAYTSLQDALSATGSCADNVEIWVAKGTYTPAASDRTISFVMKNKVAIYGGFTGTETLLSQRNWTTNATILSGDLLGDDAGFNNNSENSYHVLNNSSLNNTAILDGFTIKGGNANGEGNWRLGGGMYNTNSSPTITNCSFSSNNANSYGGMYNYNFSSPTLTNCSFSGNTATYYGGGLYNYSNSSPILTNCSFTGNTSTSGGGGMVNDYNSSPTLTNCSFSDNTVTSGGGGGMLNYSNSSPTLTNCSFSGNTATYGSGMLNIDLSSPTLTNCIIWGNSSGVDNYDGSSPSISYSLVQGVSSGTGNINGTTDPLFVDAANGNLRLQACSPAINAGSDAANSTSSDLAGNTRKVGTIDMGAYEYQESFRTWVLDADNDGYYTGEQIINCASPGTGYVVFIDQSPGDCNDNDATIHATVIYYVDADQDGYGSSTTAAFCSATPPPGYATNSDDCNDNDALEKPGQIWYKDSDNDGHGALGVDPITQCSRPVGYKTQSELTTIAGDCNDNNPAVTCISYCTIGQAGYGNSGNNYEFTTYATSKGVVTYSTTTVTTTELLNQLLKTSLVVGTGSRTFTVPKGSAGSQCIIERLPAEGTPATLPGGATSCSKLNGLPTNNDGSFRNKLLGEAITLTLNIRRSALSTPVTENRLGELRLTGNCITTDAGTFSIPSRVISYLGTNNKVSDLLALGNRALGAQLTAANLTLVSLLEISEAMAAINKGFEGCTSLYSQSNDLTCQNQPNNKVSSETISASPLRTVSGLSVMAYPNPYYDRVSFKITSLVSGQGSLEVYNLLGQKVNTVFQGHVVAGMTKTIEYAVPAAHRTPMIYIFRVGDKMETGKLLH